MSDPVSGGGAFTVGSLIGLPLGATPPRPAGPPGGGTRSAELPTVPLAENEGEGWVVRGGDALRAADHAGFRPDGVERLDYNNPFNQGVERVWFDGRIVYASEQGQVDLQFDADFNCIGNAVAMEYQVVYGVELDDAGKLVGEPELVPGQYNIYDSIPGMDKYSPLWQFNYVLVPRDYVANTLRSERDCLASGYPIAKSTVVEN
jgi:hypothetical protein